MVLAATAALYLAASGGIAAEEGTSAKKVTLALVGAAHSHTPGFVRRVQARKDVTVKYVWDHDAARAEKNARQLGAKIVNDLQEIWSDPAVDGVAIYAETNRHYDLVLAAAKARKHMLVEKPLCGDASKGREMAAAIEKAGVLFNTGYAMRGQPAHQFLKEQIAQGNLGKITRIRGSTCHSASLGHWLDKEWRWMTDRSVAEVGAFGDLGTHTLDILMWLLGDVESVTADMKPVTGQYGDLDECGEALLRFKSGAIGTLAAAWVDVANPVTLEIAGTEGHATIINGQLYYQSSHVAGADGKQPWTKLPKALPHSIDLFIDAVGGQTGVPLVTPREAAARVSVMQAMYEGAQQHAWVAPR
jgi:predicted dehydrogenase